MNRIKSILVCCTILFTGNIQLFCQSDDDHKHDKKSHNYFIGVYNSSISDYYGIGLREKNLFIEGGYGGLFGRKKYKNVAQAATEAFIAEMNSRYNTSIKGTSEVKQPHWNISAGYFPSEERSFYLGVGYSSITVAIYQTVLSGENDLLLKTRNSAFDLISGIKISSDKIGIEKDGIYFDMRIGYTIPISAKVVGMPYEELFKKIKNEHQGDTEIHNIIDNMLSSIKNDPIQFLDQKIFISIAVIYAI